MEANESDRDSSRYGELSLDLVLNGTQSGRRGTKLGLIGRSLQVTLIYCSIGVFLLVIVGLGARAWYGEEDACVSADESPEEVSVGAIGRRCTPRIRK